MKSIIISFIILILLNGCGYTPIHLNKNNTPIEIKLTKLEGDDTLNRFLNLNLKKHYNLEHNEKFIITIKSKYLKQSVTKNKSGKTTEYRLVSTVNFNIEFNNYKKDLSFKESSMMKNIDNSINENEYERSLIQNHSSLIYNKLISFLETMQ
jgi:outer membrane lipopolysaccharide assembly protein LptE/RlpB